MHRLRLLPRRLNNTTPTAFGVLMILATTLALSACARKPQAGASNNQPSTQSQPTKAEQYLFPIKVASKWGFIDQTGAVVIQPHFFGVGQFSEGLAPVWVDAHPSDVTDNGFAGGKWGYIGTNGEFSISPQFDDAGEFSGGLAAVIVGASEVLDKSEDIITTKSGYVFGRIGFIDKRGKLAISPKFRVPTYKKRFQWRRGVKSRRVIESPKFANGVAIVQIAYEGTFSPKWSSQTILLKPNGPHLTPQDGYRLRGPLSDGRLLLERDHEKSGYMFPEGYVDENLNVITKFEGIVGAAGLFSEGLAVHCTNGLPYEEQDTPDDLGFDCGFIDTSGDYKIPPVSGRKARGFSEGLAAVKDVFENLYGFIDPRGKLVIEPQYYDVRDFINGFAAVQVGSKWGYINQTGSFVINPQYSQAGDFINGLALVDGADYIDTTGKYIFRASDNTPKIISDAERLSPASITGSAFFINNKGFLITNHHVVAECTDIYLTNSTEKLELVSSDPLNDLALLKSQQSNHEFARFRFDKSLPQGEEIIAFGYPLSGLLSSGGSISVGTVSATKGPRGISSLFQFDAAIQPGSSGGPVLDKKGNVVGVVVGKLNSLKFAALTGSIPENVNFAITAATVTGFLTANNIDFSKPPMIAFRKDTEELATLAKGFSVSIECHAASRD